MRVFDATKERLEQIQRRMPDFPVELVRLTRMTYHVQKSVRDVTNAALKQFDLVEPSYMVLAVLYGTEGETSNASTLGLACHEKPANLTRVCNDLETRGLIARGTREGDRRAVMISLTDAGRALIDQALPAVWQQTTHTYDGFSATELQQLEAMFARQLRNLNHLASA